MKTASNNTTASEQDRAYAAQAAADAANAVLGPPPPASVFQTEEGLALAEELLHANADVVHAQRRRAALLARLLQLREEQREAA